MWNDVGFFKQVRIVQTCWLAPFGRFLLHSHWNPGQHSQLVHKVLLCFLHTRINLKSVNTTQLDSGLRYPTCGMTEKAYDIAETQETIWLASRKCFLQDSGES